MERCEYLDCLRWLLLLLALLVLQIHGVDRVPNLLYSPVLLLRVLIPLLHTPFNLRITYHFRLTNVY
jgi:hypothetical protein